MSLLTNIQAYWKLDESSGNAADQVNSNTLTNNNAVTYGTGKINNGANFAKASTQYLSILNSSITGLNLSGDCSFSFWVKLASQPSSGSLYGFLSKQDTVGTPRQYGFAYYNLSGTYCIDISFQEGGHDFTYTLTTGTWYHIVITWTNASHTDELWVNGVSQGTDSSQSAFSSAGTGPFCLGAGLTTGSSPYRLFDGELDEVGVWSRVLTSGEISTLYNSGAGFSYPFSNSYTLSAAAGSLTLTANNATFSKGIGLLAQAGQLILTGYNATIKVFGWKNQAKSSTSWSNNSKNSTAWTNQSKNT